MRGCPFCLYNQLKIIKSMGPIPLLSCYCTFFNEEISNLGYKYIEGECENYVADKGGDA
jgi:hypothetical protein